MILLPAQTEIFLKSPSAIDYGEGRGGGKLRTTLVDNTPKYLKVCFSLKGFRTRKTRPNEFMNIFFRKLMVHFGTTSQRKVNYMRLA